MHFASDGIFSYWLHCDFLLDPLECQTPTKQLRGFRSSRGDRFCNSAVAAAIVCGDRLGDLG